MKTKLTLFVAVLAVALFGMGCSSLDKGLVAYYPFDEGEGATVTDQSGNGHNGVIKGAKWVDGVSGHALEFEKNWVNLGSFGDYSNKVTFTGWFKTSSQNVWMDILAGPSGEDVLFSLLHDHPSWGMQSNQSFLLHSKTSVIDGKWHFVAGTYDGNVQSIFVDGTWELSRPETGIFKPGLKCIGSRSISDSAASREFFIGSIDNVRIYNRALSAEEVKALYDLEKPKAK